MPLVRVLASVFFVTEPAGVEIWIDGELRATTSGTLAPELHEEARARGLDPARASARVEVANLSLGSHAVELRRKCYETVKRTLETSAAAGLRGRPGAAWRTRVASLRLTSEPPGARILLNGEARGVTPAQIDGICSGKVRVEVKHAAGKFIKDLVLGEGRGDQPRLPDPAHPRLPRAWRRRAPPASGTWPRPRRRSAQNLSRLTSLNFIAAPREAVDRILEQEKVTRQSLLPGSGSDPDLVRKVTERLAARARGPGLPPGGAARRAAAADGAAAPAGRRQHHRRGAGRGLRRGAAYTGAPRRASTRASPASARGAA